jgi:hypothetical protein
MGRGGTVAWPTADPRNGRAMRQPFMPVREDQEPTARLGVPFLDRIGASGR